MRQIVLDTETTGLEASQGHRIIEIGCVELEKRRLTGNHYHQYINPNREIDQGAIEVHGITNEFLKDKPPFERVLNEFLEFVDGAELVIHNAPFDLGFLNSEIQRLDPDAPRLEDRCKVIDTLVMARGKHPGQRNSLDALCQRYGADNSQRDLHGALLDAEILADVYLLMTGGQVNLNINNQSAADSGEINQASNIRRLPEGRPALRVIVANEDELASHHKKLDAIKASSGECIWQNSGE